MQSLSGGHGLLLLCEAELGRPMFELLNSDPAAGEAAAKNGCIATFGVGRTVPKGWVDAGSIHKSLKGVLMVRRVPLLPFILLRRDTDAWDANDMCPSAA